MATTITVTGSVALGIGSTKSPIAAKVATVPPELHGNQWGLLRLDIGPDPTDRQGGPK